MTVRPSIFEDLLVIAVVLAAVLGIAEFLRRVL
jgi:hypothetical protein